MRVRLLQSLVLCFFRAQVGYAQTPAPFRYVEANKTNYLKLADETDTMLRRDILGVWFPRTIDNENGGFHAEFNREWSRRRAWENFPCFYTNAAWQRPYVELELLDRLQDFKPESRQSMTVSYTLILRTKSDPLIEAETVFGDGQVQEKR
jgi:hypothetical protein